MNLGLYGRICLVCSYGCESGRFGVPLWASCALIAANMKALIILGTAGSVWVVLNIMFPFWVVCFSFSLSQTNKQEAQTKTNKEANTPSPSKENPNKQIKTQPTNQPTNQTRLFSDKQLLILIIHSTARAEINPGTSRRTSSPLYHRTDKVMNRIRLQSCESLLSNVMTVCGNTLLLPPLLVLNVTWSDALLIEKVGGI